MNSCDLIYPMLHVLYYEDTEFVHGHYQSIRPGPNIEPQSSTVNNQVQQPQQTVNRDQLPSISDSMCEPVAQSTNVNINCETTCDTSGQNSTRASNRGTRELSYMSA